MAIKVIAQRRELKIGKNPGVKKFVMRPDLYIPIQEKKVFAEASTHSGISAGVIKAAWDAAGEVIRTWATEGHSIPLPGLGTMRFGEGSGPSPILCARRRKETLARARTIKS